MTPLQHEHISALTRRTDFLRTELEALKKHRGMQLAAYRTDDVARRNVERIAENLMNACTDVAKILLATSDVRFPQRAREAFELLSDLGILRRDAAEALADRVRLRNILAHEYLEFRWRHIEDFIANAHEAILALVESTESFVAAAGRD